MARQYTYINTEICVQQNLEVKCLLALVAHLHDRLESFAAQRNAVDETEVVWPFLAEILREGRAVQAKVKLDAVI